MLLINPVLQWLRGLCTLQLMKTHTVQIDEMLQFRSHHKFDNTCCKMSHHGEIECPAASSTDDSRHGALVSQTGRKRGVTTLRFANRMCLDALCKLYAPCK